MPPAQDTTPRGPRSHSADTTFLIEMSRTIHREAMGMRGPHRRKFLPYYEAVKDRVKEFKEERYKGYSLSSLIWKLLLRQSYSGLPGYITSKFQDLSISTLPMPDRDAILDHTALKWALDRPGIQCQFDRFHNEIERQFGIYKQEKAHLFGNSPEAPIKIDVDEPRAAEVQENGTSPTTTAVHDEASPVTDQTRFNWSPDIIEAFQKGDLDALKTALGSSAEPQLPPPQTLQAQIDLEYPPQNRPYGPWGIPLPNLVIPEVDIYKNIKTINEYLGGLTLAYDNKTHSVRVSLSDRKKDCPPQGKVSDATVTKFTRAATKIWKWLEAMKEAKEVIPLDEWVKAQMETKKKDRKAALFEYIDKLDSKTLHKSVRKKSARFHSQKRPASAADEDNEDANDTVSSATRSKKRRKN